MTKSRHQEHISAFLTERIAAGDFPSAVYLVTERGRICFRRRSWKCRCRALSDNGLAANSLRSRQPDQTAGNWTSLCSAHRRGRIHPGQLRRPLLAEFERTDKQMITVRQLLTHTSGLPAWRPLYILAEGERDRALSVIAAEDLEYRPGTRVVYSDLGFITLGFLLERFTGKRLSELARDEIFEALGLKSTFFNPEIAMQTGIAACETGNAYERQPPRRWRTPEYANWRENVIWGEVHDGNAHFLGGAAGHAGLFSTA